MYDEEKNSNRNGHTRVGKQAVSDAGPSAGPGSRPIVTAKDRALPKHPTPNPQRKTLNAKRSTQNS
jgi:hypothetical protein